MIVGFKFTIPTDEGKFTIAPPSMLLAYMMAKRKKRNGILYSVLFFLFCWGLLINNISGVVNIMQGKDWNIFFTICIGATAAVLTYFILWNGPKAVLLFSAIETEQFKEHLELQLTKLSAMIRVENIVLCHLDHKTVKHMQKVIASMETLLEISEEVNQIEDIQTGIKFLDEFTGLYGFEVRDITKEIVNATKLN
jgi:hypothetical protein